jgi:hypothetical protein
VVALRKNLSVERGENVLSENLRHFFYITNEWSMTPDEVVDQARQRCNQENLIMCGSTPFTLAASGLPCSAGERATSTLSVL